MVSHLRFNNQNNCEHLEYSVSCYGDVCSLSRQLLLNIRLRCFARLEFKTLAFRDQSVTLFEYR